MANKIIHKHSSVITENGKAKLPSAEQLEYGEVAVNYADGVETISFKNSNTLIIIVIPALSSAPKSVEPSVVMIVSLFSAANFKFWSDSIE